MVSRAGKGDEGRLHLQRAWHRSAAAPRHVSQNPRATVRTWPHFLPCFRSPGYELGVSHTRSFDWMNLLMAEVIQFNFDICKMWVMLTCLSSLKWGLLFPLCSLSQILSISPTQTWETPETSQSFFKCLIFCT